VRLDPASPEDVAAAQKIAKASRELERAIFRSTKALEKRAAKAEAERLFTIDYVAKLARSAERTVEKLDTFERGRDLDAIRAERARHAPQGAALDAAVRERMARTGEGYREAMTAVLAERPHLWR
jgi:hypothetical protein